MLAAAAAKGIRLVLTLTNYWPFYGGQRVCADFYHGLEGGVLVIECCV